jgi:aldehyde dehydrogenase (NAD+)
MKVAPALACGNSIIIKTSEKNPFSTLFAASLANEAGIPPGALSCLTGGAEVGEALASHPAIRKISFTGSVKVGKLVHIAAAKSNLKSVTTELGGKSPIIVFPDADLEKALSDATMFLMMNGQGCALGTRLYLHHSIANRFVEKLVARIQEHCAGLGGHPLSPHTHSSPLYHHEQKYSVSKSLEVGKKQATLLCGGKFLGATGCYVEPAIFANATRDAVIVRDELFGPILVVAQFSTEEEVLSLANNTEFGLASYVWTGDVGRALRFSRLLESGSVSINGAGFISPDVPMGGWKRKCQTAFALSIHLYFNLPQLTIFPQQRVAMVLRMAKMR